MGCIYSHHTEDNKPRPPPQRRKKQTNIVSWRCREFWFSEVRNLIKFWEIEINFGFLSFDFIKEDLKVFELNILEFEAVWILKNKRFGSRDLWFLDFGSQSFKSSLIFDILCQQFSSQRLNRILGSNWNRPQITP